MKGALFIVLTRPEPLKGRVGRERALVRNPTKTKANKARERGGGEGEGERERETDREKQTETDRDRQTHTHRDRDKETQREPELTQLFKNKSFDHPLSNLTAPQVSDLEKEGRGELYEVLRKNRTTKRS